MSAPAPLDLTFDGAEVLRGGALVPGALGIAGGLIAEPGGRRVDASGYLILPGIVDLHGDGFERHLAPRRGALESHGAGLAALDVELAANGITTAVLAQFVSWEGGMRGPGFAQALAEALDAQPMRAECRLQLRLEVSLAEEFDRVRALVARHGIRYLVLNDHLPHEALAAGKRPPRLQGQALKAGRSPEAHLALMQALHEGREAAGRALAGLTADLAAAGVRMGSHDDRTGEERARYRALGADIAEFPETRAAAEAAKAAGDAVIMGAPNVVRGGSHDGRIAAAELVAEGLVDALVSDYHYPAPHRAAFRLWDAGLDLGAAWGLISEGPARLMGWQDRGRIAEGLRADLVLIERGSRRIEGVIAGGRVSYLAGALAARMVG